MQQFPFRIGRSKEAELTIDSREVSSFHARVLFTGTSYVVEDLRSRNGTFVNGNRVESRTLADGAILHVANEELRFTFGDPIEKSEGTLASAVDEQQQLIREANDLERVLTERAVRAVFQPIIRLDAPEKRVAYETLGRPALPGTDYNIGKLIAMAVERGEAARLSRLMRDVALEDLVKIPEKPISIFFNLHPAEMDEPDAVLPVFMAVQKSLRPGQRAVVEIHESAVTDLDAMEEIRAELRACGIALAYDDFGAGQSRLMELVEVPPEYIKLDMGLIRNIDKVPKKRDLVAALVKVMVDLDITVLAEGIERKEEGDVCRELGCTLGQGYFYGRPLPAGS